MSGAQLRMIYALANSAGLDNDTLHDVVLGIAGKESLRALSAAEGARVIDRLKAYAGERSDIPNRATQKQRWLIRRIEEELGWSAEPARLRGMVERVAGVSDMKFLTVRQARKVIEALKAMQEGGRGTRPTRGASAAKPDAPRSCDGKAGAADTEGGRGTRPTRGASAAKPDAPRVGAALESTIRPSAVCKADFETRKGFKPCCDGKAGAADTEGGRGERRNDDGLDR